MNSARRTIVVADVFDLIPFVSIPTLTLYHGILTNHQFIIHAGSNGVRLKRGIKGSFGRSAATALLVAWRDVQLTAVTALVVLRRLDASWRSEAL